MPIPFDKFRLLNGPKKEVDNLSYTKILHVRVDDNPEVIVAPQQRVEIPDGVVIEFEVEAIS
jgi:hypothetical protein